MKRILKPNKSNQGAASIEMGLICALIVLAMLAALQGFADGSISMWKDVSERTATAISGQPN